MPVSLPGLDSLQAWQYVMWCLMSDYTNNDTAGNISSLKSHSIQWIFVYIVSFAGAYNSTAIYGQIFYNITFVLDMIRITVHLQSDYPTIQKWFRLCTLLAKHLQGEVSHNEQAPTLAIHAARMGNNDCARQQETDQGCRKCLVTTIAQKHLVSITLLSINKKKKTLFIPPRGNSSKIVAVLQMIRSCFIVRGKD